jgi:hypothetical protein
MSALFTLAQSSQPADGGVYSGLPAVADGGGGGQTPARSRQIRALGAADDSGVDAAGGELVDAAGVWQWGVGRFVPTLIIVMMLIDLGAFIGTQGENKFGKDTQDVRWKRTPDYQ